MKLVVKKSMSKGIFWVGFKGGEISDAERHQIEIFGAPQLQISYGDSGLLGKQSCPINEIDESLVAGFDSQKEAEAYAQSIEKEFREKMDALMKEVDDFTSEEEIDSDSK